MTNFLKFRVGNRGHTCYFAVGTWLSNFIHSFSNPLGTSVQKWSLYKNFFSKLIDKLGGFWFFSDLYTGLLCQWGSLFPLPQPACVEFREKPATIKLVNMF